MGLATIPEEESDNFNDKDDFIELVSCRINDELCFEHLKFINEGMRLSRIYWVNKYFPQAIEKLKIAFQETNEINSLSCLPCAELFRSRMIKSLEAMCEDLGQMTTGFIKAKRHKSSYELALTVLKELKAEM